MPKLNLLYNSLRVHSFQRTLDAIHRSFEFINQWNLATDSSQVSEYRKLCPAASLYFLGISLLRGVPADIAFLRAPATTGC